MAHGLTLDKLYAANNIIKTDKRLLLDPANRFERHRVSNILFAAFVFAQHSQHREKET